MDRNLAVPKQQHPVDRAEWEFALVVFDQCLDLVLPSVLDHHMFCFLVERPRIRQRDRSTSRHTKVI